MAPRYAERASAPEEDRAQARPPAPAGPGNRAAPRRGSYPARVNGPLETIRFLASARGEDALARARATRGRDPMARRADLDRIGTGEEARAVLSMDDLRVRAAAKTPLADGLLLTRDALEQASPSPVADERATRFAAFRTVADLGAAVGFDTIALALAGRTVVAVERDPVRVVCLRHNVAVAGVADRVRIVEGDFLADPPEAEAAFLDPDRRPDGRRTRDPERFEPPPAAWAPLAARYRGLLLKLPPVLEDDPGAGPPPIPTEWVSLHGEMKEARRGFGTLSPSAPRRAVLLPGGATLEGEGRPWPSPRAPHPPDELFDPDPAVVVSRLLGDLAHAHGAAPLHPRIAYLVASPEAARGLAPYGTRLPVLGLAGTSPADLARLLDAFDVGRLDVRTRGVEDSADVWRRRLRPRGARAATLVITRGPDDRYLAVLSGPVPAGAGGAMGSRPPGRP